VKGKRLFWVSIIVVELVVIYLLWRPRQDRFVHPSRKTLAAKLAVLPPAKEDTAEPVAAAPEIKAPPVAPPRAPEARTPAAPLTKAPVAKRAPGPAQPSPNAKGSAVAMLPSKPSPIPHVPPHASSKAPAVNASLISRIPIPAKKLTPPPAPLSPLESFWCQMSTIDSNCNCKGNEERAANLAPMRQGTN